jgi:putative endonuclease
MKQYFVYILASESKTIYTWVTNNLERRIYEHKNWLCDWFTKKYDCTKLVFFEVFNNIEDAILSEKRIKNWRRDWKVNLIEKGNPYWEDLNSKFNDSESSSKWQK